MKLTTKLLIIVYNLLIMYTYVFSSGTSEELELQIDSVYDGYEIMGVFTEEDLANMFDIADQNDIVILFKKVNYGGVTSYDYEYDIYNFDVVKDDIKYHHDGKVINTVPLSKQKINEIDNTYMPTTPLKVFGEDITPIEQYIKKIESERDIEYWVNSIGEMDALFLTSLVNGKMILAFVALFILSMIFNLLSRSREIACLYTNGKTDIEIIKFQFMRILKAHLIILVLINVIPVIYLLLLSLSHLIMYLIYILIANLLFVVLYFFISYIIIPIVVKSANALALLKGQKNLGTSLNGLLIVCLIFTIAGMISISTAINDFNEPNYYSNVIKEDKFYDLYTLEGCFELGSENSSLGYEANVEIASKVLYLEQNYYLYDNASSIFDSDTFEFKEEFINDSFNNRHVLNSNMFNFLEVKDINGNLIINAGSPTIYIPESKFEEVKGKYSKDFEFVMIKDDQKIYTPGWTMPFEFYATDAYYIVDEIYIDEEYDQNVYEPSYLGMFFLEEDVKYIKGKYFPQANITTFSSELFTYFEEIALSYFSTLNSAIILLVTLVVGTIVYYKALFLKNRQQILINLINGNNIALIILKMNIKMIIMILLLAILAYFTYIYIWLLIVIIHLIVIVIEYIRILRCNYIQEIKSEV